jgi:hypothetical protein
MHDARSRRQKEWRALDAAGEIPRTTAAEERESTEPEADTARTSPEYNLSGLVYWQEGGEVEGRSTYHERPHVLRHLEGKRRPRSHHRRDVKGEQ